MAYDKNALKQLAKPSGLGGIAVLDHLNRVNQGINETTYDCLRPKAGDRILETGFGGGALLEMIVSNNPDISAIGTDISPLAVSEAKNRFRDQTSKGTLRFCIAEPGKLPFSAATFNKVCCVNVIYFWTDPLEELNELHRVTKPGGLIVLSYAHGSPDGTTKFPTSKVTDWLKTAGFTEITHDKHQDHENGTYFCTTALVAESDVTSR